MASVDPHDDDRFRDAEAEVDHGAPWRFREPSSPNPLTIEVEGWTTGVTRLGPASFMTGRDRDGKLWSVLVGSVVLVKRLAEGLVEEWDDEKREFVVVDVLGPAQPGEVVSIKYVGDVAGARYEYPNFRISRRPPTPRPSENEEPDAATTAPADVAEDEGIPF